MLKDMIAGLWMFYVFKMMSDKDNIDKKVCLKSEKVAQLIIVFFLLFFISQDERKEDKQQVLIPDI